MERQIPRSLTEYLKEQRALLKGENIERVLKFQNDFIRQTTESLTTPFDKNPNHFLRNVRLMCLLPASQCSHCSSNIANMRLFYQKGKCLVPLALPLFVQKFSEYQNDNQIYRELVAIFMGSLILYERVSVLLSQEKFKQDTQFLFETAKNLGALLDNRIYKVLFEAATAPLNFMRHGSTEALHLSYEVMALCMNEAPEEMQPKLVSHALRVFFRKSRDHPYLQRKRLTQLGQDYSYLLMAQLLELDGFEDKTLLKIIKHEVQRNSDLSQRKVEESNSVSMRDTAIAGLLGEIKSRRPKFYWGVWGKHFFPLIPFRGKAVKERLYSEFGAFCEKERQLLKLAPFLIAQEKMYHPLLSLLVTIKANIAKENYSWKDLIKFGVKLIQELQGDGRANIRRNALILFQLILDRLLKKQRTKEELEKLKKLSLLFINSVFTFYRKNSFQGESGELLETVGLLLRERVLGQQVKAKGMRMLKHCMSLLKDPNYEEKIFRLLASCCLLGPSYLQNFHNFNQQVLCYWLSFFPKERVVYLRFFLDTISSRFFDDNAMKAAFQTFNEGLLKHYSKLVRSFDFESKHQSKEIVNVLHFLKEFCGRCSEQHREQILSSLEEGLLFLLENLNGSTQTMLITSKVLQFYTTFELNEKKEVVPFASERLLSAFDSYLSYLKDGSSPSQTIDSPKLEMIENIAKAFLVGRACSEAVKDFHLDLIESITICFNSCDSQGVFELAKKLCLASGLLEVVHQMYKIKVPPGKLDSEVYGKECKWSLVVDLISDAQFNYVVSHPSYLALYSVLLSFVRSDPSYAPVLVPRLSKFSLWPTHIVKLQYAHFMKGELIQLFSSLLKEKHPSRLRTLIFQDLTQWQFMLENLAPKLRVQSTSPDLLNQIQLTIGKYLEMRKPQGEQRSAQWMRLMPFVLGLRGDERYALLGPDHAATAICNLFEQLFHGQIFLGRFRSVEQLEGIITKFRDSKEIETMGITIRQLSDPLIVLERVVARLSVLLDDDQWREVDKVKKKIHAEFMMAEVGKMVGKLLGPSIIQTEESACELVVSCFRRVVVTHFSHNLLYPTINHAVKGLFGARLQTVFVEKTHDLWEEYRIDPPEWMREELKAIKSREAEDALEL